MNLRALVIDDEEGIRLSALRALSGLRLDAPAPELCPLGAGVVLDVEACASGQEGLARLADRPVDLLLVDYRLSDMLGTDLLDHVPGRIGLAVLISGFDVAQAADRGDVHEVLTKPFTPRELIATVRRAGSALLLRREVRRLREDTRAVRLAFLSLLAQELDVTMDTVQNSLQLIRRGGIKNLSMLGCMIDVALERLGSSREVIAGLLDGPDGSPPLADMDLDQAARVLRAAAQGPASQAPTA